MKYFHILIYSYLILFIVHLLAGESARMWLTYSCDGDGATDQSIVNVGNAGIGTTLIG